MSTFCGQTTEYPSISLDRFDGLNVKNATFFLSHNHRDHTQGLFTDTFIYKLQSNTKCKLYCSEVTKQLLLLDGMLEKYLQKWPALEKSIVALPVEESKVIPVIDPDTGQEMQQLTVTLLPAGHCPGSVMFLIEGDSGTVLYTGDFRLEKEDLCNMKDLHSGNGVKVIKSLYVDTTFCVPNALHLPSRQESAQHAIRIVEEWITQSPHHVIHLHHKTDLGYEHLYRDLANHFQTKIHVLPKKFNEYKKVGDMQCITTADPTLTQIHACRSRRSGGYTRQRHHLPCEHRGMNGSQLNVRTITVSTISFVQKDSTEKPVRRYGDHYYRLHKTDLLFATDHCYRLGVLSLRWSYRVLYSFHSSYAEVRDMVLYLKPSRAAPNVIPIDHTQQQIQERLDRFVQLSKQKVERQTCSQESRPLGNIKTKEDRKRRNLPLCQYSDDEQLDFGETIGTPVKKRPRNNNIQDAGDQMINSEESSDAVTGHGEVSAEDKVAFPLLFGKQDLDGDLMSSPPESYDPSQSLFSDDGLLPEDREWLKQSMESVQSLQTGGYGSESEYCSETGTEDSIEDGNGDAVSCEETKETASIHENDRSSNSVELCGKPINDKLHKEESKGKLSTFETPSQDINLSILNKKSMNPDNHKQCKIDDTVEGTETNCTDLQKDCSTSRLLGSNLCNNNGLCVKSDECKDCRDSAKPRLSPASNSDDDLDNSVQVVEVVGNISSSSDSTIELEQVFFRSSRERRVPEVMNDYPKGSKDGDTPEEIQRPSVMRYPTSGFHSNVNQDKCYAVQGYHNLITNIEKILKSPTRSDGDGDGHDVVVVDCRGATRLESSSGESSSAATKRKSHPQKERTETVTLKETAESAKNEDSSSAKCAASHVTTAEEMQEPGESEGECKQEVLSLGSVECIDLTNDDEEEEVEEDGHDGTGVVGSSCCSEDWFDPLESELSSAHESEGDTQNEAVDKHKRLWKKRPHNESNDYSSDSDSDVEGYQSENWFMDLRKIERHQVRNGPEAATSVVKDNEVIVLDDTSTDELMICEQQKHQINEEINKGTPDKVAMERSDLVECVSEIVEGDNDLVEEDVNDVVQEGLNDLAGSAHHSVDVITNAVDGTKDSVKDANYLMDGENELDGKTDLVKGDNLSLKDAKDSLEEPKDDIQDTNAEIQETSNLICMENKSVEADVSVQRKDDSMEKNELC